MTEITILNVIFLHCVYKLVTDEILENWINSKANNKYPYSSINENELISDIIFESIVSDDLNELIEKFANRYGKNNA